MTTRYHLLTSAEAQIAISAESVCIAMIDEADGSSAALFNDWNTFRAAYPLRPYFLVEVAGAANDMFIPTNMQSAIISDPLTRAFLQNPTSAFTAYNGTIDAQRSPGGVTRDNGNTALATDLFDYCDLGTLQPGSNVFLFVDSSGSMSVANVRATLDLLQTNCDNANITITSVFNGLENYIAPFISFTGLPGVP